MMKKSLRAHFIPNNHLDREWTLDFQWTRALTVDFFDALIDILKKIPGYIFLLDSQTVPLEDYFEIRPEKEPIIKKYIKEGRIEIGPWYTALDSNTVQGESITRNLLVGHNVARKYGPVMKVGYTPFGFGQVGQLPQIYKGFGIDSCFFYRGISDADAPDPEFYWVSPDGTEIFSSRFGTMRRVNFYFEIWRKSSFTENGNVKDRESHWKDGQISFRLCNEESRYDHGSVLRPQLRLDKEALKKWFRTFMDQEKKIFLTPEIPMMHGMDTRAPDIREKQVVEDIQNYLHKDEEFFYSSMSRYAKDLYRAARGMKLHRVYGECRSGDSFTNIVSARAKQKLAESKAENMLIRNAEPFSAIATAACGREWPRKYLEQAWKTLLICHPHDTAAGCGIDRMEEDFMYRANQVYSISRMLRQRSLKAIQERIDTTDVKPENIVITVFNPSPFARTENTTAFIAIPKELNIKDFILTEPVPRRGGLARPSVREKQVSYAILNKQFASRVYRDDEQIAMMCLSDEYKISFLAENIPALGYKRYVLKKPDYAKASSGRGLPATKALAGERVIVSEKANTLENEFLKVKINPDGTIDLRDKNRGKTYKGLHYFEDVGEFGQGWEHLKMFKDRLITSRGVKADISLEHNKGLYASFRVSWKLRIPAKKIYFDENYDKAKRSAETKPLEIASTYILRSGAKSLEVETEIDNKSQDHRLRVIFPAGLNAKVSSAESAYDVMDRPVGNGKDYPFLRFVDISDRKNGLAFISEGIREFEALKGANGAVLGITLLRAFEIQMCTVGFYRTAERYPEETLSQCIGKIRHRYFICPHKGTWASSGVTEESERFNLPLVVAMCGAGNKGDLPKAFSFFEIKGKNVMLSALKIAERSNSSLIVRVFNPDSKPARAEIKFFKKVRSARFVNMNEDALEGRKPAARGNSVSFIIPYKKIVTLSVSL
ncbi:hypothetical protein COY52_01405 [Candidatus Desantisbacteria bacterium CG_4_10_14_0_8_um_filter_48_22]|uniref:Glycoside hydrolase family 38 central domain-containing protein n=1 Tax=Candidatus Desantisbacteria bacterium CG_4_10_14_0_8_um_filter_48_22 TaxID=1974543 RepID=A0A2M7SEZ5_9BACT|nr:MAG: hypothetical protein AUJ67_08750 [Candidatus Desantisbacteria bacterium CG1_02_49_89]PIV54819.1 MAG: hypothetical protein COS16_09095 [Candidatus Desantisbacteria bacterium CG02_land_8_20_14_3_00_49_13]PIZ18064.1 MAG: hypothetical protein COY52_01405 [Candidatus Desantisbacteria bacterium CG_4_10_14_0_8_um_filter_48_22]